MKTGDKLLRYESGQKAWVIYPENSGIAVPVCVREEQPSERLEDGSTIYLCDPIDDSWKRHEKGSRFLYSKGAHTWNTYWMHPRNPFTETCPRCEQEVNELADYICYPCRGM